MSTNTYHHGELRGELIRRGIELLSRGGPGSLDTQPVKSLSLRGLAREAGVSATAVYHHFPSKEALLEEIAVSLLTDLIARWEQLSPDHIARAYLDFFRARPGLLNLLFGQELSGSARVLELQQQAFQVLLDRIPGEGPRKERTAMLLWVLVHGLSSLAVSGAVGVPPGSCPGGPEIFEQDPGELLGDLTGILRPLLVTGTLESP